MQNIKNPKNRFYKIKTQKIPILPLFDPFFDFFPTFWPLFSSLFGFFDSILNKTIKTWKYRKNVVFSWSKYLKIYILTYFPYVKSVHFHTHLFTYLNLPKPRKHGKTQKTTKKRCFYHFFLKFIFFSSFFCFQKNIKISFHDKS